MRPPVIAALALTAAGTIAACGGKSHPAATRTSPSRIVASAPAAAPRMHLPPVVSGVIRLDDGETLGLTGTLDHGFATSSGSAASLATSTTSNAEAFTRLCAGNADIALVTQAPTASQLGECAAHGITFPLQSDGQPRAVEIAADAIVLATQNGTNVGGDCLTRRSVRDIFAPGSAIDNWSQLGFDNLGLSTAGQAPIGSGGRETGTFPLFANLALGVRGPAGLSDVRSDFRALGRDDDVLNAVTGDRTIQRLTLIETNTIRARLNRDARAIQAAVNAAEAAANARVLARIAAANRALAKKQTVLSAAQKQQIAVQNARADRQAKLDAGTAARAAFIARVRAGVLATYGPQIAAAQTPGVLGVFRYTYYTLYENLLRPMEIWDPVTAAQVLEGRGVATNESRQRDQISASMRHQAGGGMGVVETIAIPPSPTGAGSSYVAASDHKVRVPTGGPINVDTTPSCIFPSNQTIISGAYPLSIQLLAYVPKRELARTEVRDYLAYLLGRAQSLVAQARLVPLDDVTRAREYRAVTGHALPQSLYQTGASPTSGAASSSGGVVAASAVGAPGADIGGGAAPISGGSAPGSSPAGPSNGSGGSGIAGVGGGIG